MCDYQRLKEALHVHCVPVKSPKRLSVWLKKPRIIFSIGPWIDSTSKSLTLFQKNTKQKIAAQKS